MSRDGTRQDKKDDIPLALNRDKGTHTGSANRTNTGRIIKNKTEINMESNYDVSR
jgi:hypothetical protein